MESNLEPAALEAVVRFSICLRFAVLCALFLANSGRVRAQCTPWSNPFGVPGVTKFAVGDQTGVTSAVLHDDGSGQALFVSGRFGYAGGAPAGCIARWNGTTWSALGAGVSGVGARITALAVYDEGGGPVLYAGGSFVSISGVPASNIARWNGFSWQALGSGVPGNVTALHVHDDGSGPALYVGGSFSGGVRRYAAGGWTSLPTFPFGEVTAFATHTSPSGPRLYAAGQQAGVASWNGSAWSFFVQATTPPIPPFPPAQSYVVSLASYGGELYCGGRYEQIGGQAIRNLARWNGTSWSSVGGATIISSDALELATLDLGAGAELIAATSTSTGIYSVARWNGSSWSGLGGYVQGTAGAFVATPPSAPGGTVLYIGGGFPLAGGVQVNNVTRWTAAAGFAALGASGAPNEQVNELVVHDDGSGPALYAGGFFTTVGTQSANYVARWDGTSWSALGGGTSTGPGALISFDDGSGRALYVGASVAGLPPNIARWNGTSWTGVGAGFDDQVYDLTEFDDGSGAALYAVGRFYHSGATSLANVARWDGANWVAVGTGITAANYALCAAAFDDGTGAKLYAGVRRPGGYSVSCWDGSVWTTLGATFTGDIRDLEVFDDGTGAALYMCGFLDQPPTITTPVRKWTGTSWVPVGSGLTGAAYRMCTFRNGTTPVLVLGGAMYFGISNIAQWSGTSWSPLGSGLDYQCWSLATYFDGSAAGPVLYAGGSFANAGGGAAPFLARYDACGALIAPLCFGDGGGAACPCGNTSSPGSQAGCTNSLGTGGKLVASGNPSLSADSIVLIGTGMTDAPTLYFQGTSSPNGSFGTPFGDGLRCVGGSVIRLATKTNVGGTSQFPAAGDPSLSSAGGVSAGSNAFVQAYYRNVASFCTSAPFNLTNGVGIRWAP